MSYICSGKRWGKALVTVVAVLVFAGAQGRAADSIKIKESQADKVKCDKYKEDGETYTDCDRMTRGKFSLKAKVFTEMDLSDPEVTALLHPDTPVQITVGNWSWSAVFRDDLKYKLGKKKAKFRLTHEKCPEDEDKPCKVKKHGTISLAVTKKGLKVTISAKTGGIFVGDDFIDFESSIIAEAHRPEELLPDGIVATINDEIVASINIGDVLIQEAVVGISGTARTPIKMVDDGEDWTVFDLYSVKLKSTGIVP